MDTKPWQSAESVCRLCFTERRPHELIFIGSELQECIELLTSVKIFHVPNAPTSICVGCKATLEAYETFRQMCQENNGIIQETFLHVTDLKRRKVAPKDEVVETDDVPIDTIKQELGVLPCDCSTDQASPLENMEIKVEDTVVEKPAPDPIDVKIITENDINRDVVITILNSSPACKRLIRDKLARRFPIANKDMNLICRTVCSPLFTPMIENGISVSTKAKQKLAKTIVEAFDSLGAYREGAPEEFQWFWKFGGQNKGNHSGKIQHWIRNTSKTQGIRRKRRNPNPRLTNDEANAVEELGQLNNLADYLKVNQLMTSTFVYRQSLRIPNRGPSSVCAEFPHLLWYGHLMIDQEFDRMYPKRRAIGTLSSILPLCLMLDHPFSEITCQTIQALMKVMAELTLQGSSRRASSTSLPPIEDYASVFVRWQQPETDLDYFVENIPGDPPYIVCLTRAFVEGQYYVIITNTAIDCGHNFDRAFDVLVKAYKVFNFTVPGRANKVIELFDLVYGLQMHSRLNNVNKLFGKIKKAVNPMIN